MFVVEGVFVFVVVCNIEVILVSLNICFVCVDFVDELLVDELIVLMWREGGIDILVNNMGGFKVGFVMG